METHIASTPFGSRPMSLALVAAQRDSREKIPEGKAVDKWQVYRDLCEGKTLVGVNDRSLAILAALLSFYPDSELSTENDLIVFPSNKQLSLRAHGMADATLRRHLASLVDSGLVIRRDSPNGKRYARKDRAGEIEDAFGFSLAPLLLRAGEFEAAAERVRAETKALKLLRERITLQRRDIHKLVEVAVEEDAVGDWAELWKRFRRVVDAIPRRATLAELEPFLAELNTIRESVDKLLETHINVTNPSGNESRFERQHTDSNTNSFEFEPGLEKDQGAAVAPRLETRSQPPAGYPLGMVLRACPDIADYARNGIADWGDLMETANLVRGALGVSPDAWNQACEAMGAVDAAIMVAAMLQRGEAISSPGGYLRSLTAKAKAGEFSIGPVLMALLRGRGNGMRARAG